MRQIPCLRLAMLYIPKVIKSVIILQSIQSGFQSPHSLDQDKGNRGSGNEIAFHVLSSACASLVHVHSRNVIRVREVETFSNKRKTVLRCLTSLLLPFLLPCYPFVSPNKLGVGTQIFLILSVSSQ